MKASIGGVGAGPSQLSAVAETIFKTTASRPGEGSDWNSIVSRISTMASNAMKTEATPGAQVRQLSELLKIQTDVTRYQLKVELVSKVSESAVASVRKLQQNQ